MKDIINFIKDHPLISWNSIERSINIPKGTLRAGKLTSDKYNQAITDLLVNYGYVAECNTLKSNVATCNKPIIKDVAECNKEVEKVITEVKPDTKLIGKYKIDSTGLYIAAGANKIRFKADPDKFYLLYHSE